MALLEEGKATLRQMKDKAPMNIRLGYFHSISASLVPPIVKALYEEKENQDIRFQFMEDTSYNICEQLKTENWTLHSQREEMKPWMASP